MKASDRAWKAACPSERWAFLIKGHVIGRDLTYMLSHGRGAKQCEQESSSPNHRMYRARHAYYCLVPTVPEEGKYC